MLDFVYVLFLLSIMLLLALPLSLLPKKLPSICDTLLTILVLSGIIWEGYL